MGPGVGEHRALGAALGQTPRHGALALLLLPVGLLGQNQLRTRHKLTQVATNEGPLARTAKCIASF